jgi:hypothetical protein
MKKMLLLAAAAAFAMSASAGGPGASSAGTGAKAGSPIHGQATLYDQNSGDAGIGIVSQNFEATFDAYDAQGADDFAVPSGQCWKITGVNTTGVYFNGSGPAPSVHVTFYKQKSGKPNEAGIIADFPSIVPTDSGGSFSIALPSAVKAKGGKKYWVSVYANMDFGAGGEWGWETRNPQAGGAGQWKNPGNGFATGCTSYGDLTTCIPSGEGPDYMFSLTGKSKAC